MEIRQILVKPDMELSLHKYSDAMDRFDKAQEIERWMNIVSGMRFEGEESKGYIEFFLWAIKERLVTSRNIKIVNLGRALAEHKNRRLELLRIKDSITGEHGETIQADLMAEFERIRGMLIDVMPFVFPDDF
jgi:hypothetical protein